MRLRKVAELRVGQSERNRETVRRRERENARRKIGAQLHPGFSERIDKPCAWVVAMTLHGGRHHLRQRHH